MKAAKAQVKAVAEDHLRQIEEKIAKLQSMRATLIELVEKCAGDHRPDCPIIEIIAGAVVSDRQEGLYLRTRSRGPASRCP